MRATISVGPRQRLAQSGARAYLENRPSAFARASRTKRCGANACAGRESNHVTTVSMSVPRCLDIHIYPSAAPTYSAKGRASRLPRRKPIFAGPGRAAGCRWRWTSASVTVLRECFDRSGRCASREVERVRPTDSATSAAGGLLHLDAGGAHHLAPLFGFFGQQPAAGEAWPAARRRARQCAPWPWDRPARR